MGVYAQRCRPPQPNLKICAALCVRRYQCTMLLPCPRPQPRCTCVPPWCLRLLMGVPLSPPPPSVPNSSETFGGAQRVNIELQKLGARGVSILFASGDIGVSRVEGDGDNCTTFSATFPASSPWVTAVGGTTNAVRSSLRCFVLLVPPDLACAGYLCSSLDGCDSLRALR